MLTFSFSQPDEPDRCAPREAEAIGRALGDDVLVHTALGNRGAALRAANRFEEALAAMAEEEAIVRRLDDLAGLQSCIGNQGLVYGDRRDYDRAAERFAEQERIARQLGDPTLINRALAAQARVLADRGDPETALVLLGRQEAECREHGDLAGLAPNLASRASVLLFEGRLDEADAALVESIGLARRLSAESVEAMFRGILELARMDAGTYGLSLISGRPIPRERLEAIPWATELVEEKVGGLGRR